MKLFFREFGEGEKVLIILHGLFGLSDNWVTIGKIFSEKLNCRVIIPDLRNHGKSQWDSTHTYQSMSEDLNELIEDLKISSFYLLGHSMGGKIAMLFALNNPEKVEKLIIADIAPVKYHNKELYELVEVLINFPFNKMKSRKEIENELNRKISNERLVQLLLKNVQNYNNSYSWKFNIRSISDYMEDILDFANIADKKFLSPTLFLKGDVSDYIKPEHETIIKYFFPNSSIKVVINAGHWLHVENPDDFQNYVINFLL